MEEYGKLQSLVRKRRGASDAGDDASAAVERRADRGEMRPLDINDPVTTAILGNPAERRGGRGGALGAFGESHRGHAPGAAGLGAVSVNMTSTVATGQAIVGPVTAPNDAAAKGKSADRPAGPGAPAAGAQARQDAQWFARFMENLPGLAWIKDEAGRYVYANAAAEAAFGKKLAELRGRTDAELFPPETAAQFSLNDLAALKSAGIQTVETLRHPDGGLHHSIVSKFPIPGADGSTFIGGIAIDVTERRRAEEALRESEARKTAIFEAALDCIITIDDAGNILEFNPAAERVFRCRRDDVVGRRLSEVIVPPDSRERHEQGLARCVATGESTILDRRIEQTAQRADGSEFPVELTITRIESPGRPIFTAYLRDITERKEAEAALRETEARFREAANSAPAPVWMTNSEGKIEFGNQALEEFAGLSAQELLGDAWLSMIHADDLPRVIEARGKAWANDHAPYAFEARFKRRDGEWRWLEVSSKPRLDSAGDFHGYVGLAVDRTEARRAETVLRESEERFRLMSENAPVMIWMSDVNGRCLHLNRMQREFWAVNDEKLSDFDWGTMLHPEDAIAVGAEVQKALADQSALSVQGRFRNASGEYRILQTEAQPRFSAGGEFLGLIGVNVDVTDTLRAQQALRESEARYRAVVESQAEMVCRFRNDGTILFANSAYARARATTAEELTGRNFWGFVAEEDRPAVRAMLDQLTPEKPEIRIENRFETAEGTRWTLWTNRALSFDPQRRWIEAQSTGIDITERRQAEEHKRLLLDELNHRVKNTLMTVQAIANLSLSSDYTPEQLRESFTSRLLALSRVHNLLTDESWMGASLKTVLSQALTPYGYSPNGTGRIRLSGPPVSLSAKQAQTFAMAFHELATNAGKYGALAATGGGVDVSWSLDDGEETPFALTWTEAGGPKVEPPTRKGFGAMMITQILAAQIEGDVTLDYRPGGLVCRMRGTI